MKKCRTKYCRGLVIPETSHSPYCSKCRSARWKQSHPLKYSFKALRSRAKERGHSFDLTFDEYREFAERTGYGLLKGKEAHSLSINRIRSEEGYHKDNIEALTLSMNSRARYAPLPGWMKEEMEQQIKRELEARLDPAPGSGVRS